MNKKRFNLLVCIGALFISSAASAESVFILVHGTWGIECGWHAPGGDFFTALQDGVQKQDGRVVSFAWSGRNNHESRVRAARRLEHLIVSYPSNTAVYIVAHSHGTNVAILTSQYLDEREGQRGRIKVLYSLATPVSDQWYQPNMAVIQSLYHLFSFGDPIQPIFGLFTREFRSSDRVANLRVYVDERQPDHTMLHSPVIGRWLHKIHDQLAHEGIGSFEQFSFQQPGIIRFYSESTPIYEHRDDARGKLRAEDSQQLAIQRRCLMCNFAKRKGMGAGGVDGKWLLC